MWISDIGYDATLQGLREASRTYGLMLEAGDDPTTTTVWLGHITDEDCNGRAWATPRWKRSWTGWPGFTVRRGISE